MVKLPEISSTYHQYFIHEFFFPLINAYTGAPVTFIWRGPNRDSLSKITQILQTLPIRSSDKVVEHNLKYYAPFDQNWNEYSSQALLLRKEGKNIAEKNNKVWKQL